jgi:hypothetical protein
MIKNVRWDGIDYENLGFLVDRVVRGKICSG